METGNKTDIRWMEISSGKIAISTSLNQRSIIINLILYFKSNYR